jgi:hypothetical protein
MEAASSAGLAEKSGLAVYPRSVAESEHATYFLARDAGGKHLGIRGDAAGFEGTLREEGIFLGPLSPANASRLRGHLPWLRPQLLGLHKSVGFGDRLGLATPGHIRAVRSAEGIAPIFAQQSMRENARTGRSPQQVMDEAMWGVFEEGWREPWGADADHLKTAADVDICVAAGYTFFTIDPGDYVDAEVDTQPVGPGDLDEKLAWLAAKVDQLPWRDLDDDMDRLRGRYLERQFEVEGLVLEFEPWTLMRAAAKYGRAIAHTARMYRHAAAAHGSRSFELEVSVDETATPTTALEHWFIASELARLEVQWVSLAPRYVGRFEKGVDYIGDLDEFEREFAKHATIARVLGPYKLSLHSGSDKFSVYPLVARHARDLIHLKTAGTSYLEALRTLAGSNPSLFRQILVFALERFETDRATYHLSGEAARVPPPGGLTDDKLAEVLDLFDGREVLHVTFGSVVDRFGPPLRSEIAAHEQAYYAALEAHFGNHMSPFVSEVGAR